MKNFNSPVISWSWLVAGVILTFGNVAGASTNVWTKGTDGFWQEAFWSLGVLPNSSQSVSITNASGQKLEINATTAQTVPASLVVHDLLMNGSNTLALNQVPTNVPFQIITNRLDGSALTVGGGAVLRNTGSAIVVQRGFVSLANGQIYQDGGLFRATNGTMFLYNGGAYYLTNGLFEGMPNLIHDCSFNQFAGAATLSTLRMDGGTYHLAGGQLVVRGAIWLTASQQLATFTQDNGTNRTVSLTVESTAIVGGAGAHYFLNGGLLGAGDVGVGARGTFHHDAGLGVVTNTLLIHGASRYYPPVSIPASYTLAANGMLSARNIVLDNAAGFSFFSSSGTVTVSENVRFVGPPDCISSFSIAGGQLSCSNFLSEGPVIDVLQTGGSVVVTNSMLFGGYYPGVYSGNGARFARYNFSAGTLSASNLTLAATMILGSSGQSGRITNNGLFQMAGVLEVGDANEQRLGRFLLLSNAVINLGNGAAILNFANSSAESWNEGAVLTVTNWNGSLNGGGSDQLRFGPHASGLKPAQLSQIRFVNPAGLPAGSYSARILNTGEVAPAILSIIRNNKSIVIGWSGNFSLERSTNVAGPYLAIPDATSPYTNTVEGRQGYFRLVP